MRMFKPADLFDLKQTEHAALFNGCEYAWDALKKLKDYIKATLKPGLRKHHVVVRFDPPQGHQFGERTQGDWQTYDQVEA